MLERLISFLRGGGSHDVTQVARKHEEHAATWSLDERVCSFSNRPADTWRLRDACEGTLIMGASGSGKTSGSGRLIAKSMLRNGFGGLVLCAKSDEPELWRQYARETGREESLLYFGEPGREWAFNFLDYECQRPGAGAGLTENLVNLFLQVAEISENKHGRGGKDDFWQRTMKQMLRNAIDIVSIARGGVSLTEIHHVIQSAPQSLSQTRSVEWQERSDCYSYLKQAEEAANIDRSRLNDFQMAGQYWMQEFPSMADKTRSIIVSSFTSMADGFLRGKLRNLFCGETNCVPEMVLNGTVVVVALPVKEYAEIGQFAAALWKYMLQKALERRADLGTESARPVFIWADEAQYFFTSYDQLFQTTARSAKAATVYLTQNLPNLYDAFGGDGAGKSKADSLLGNLGTKIFHANSDPVTNHWASETIGKTSRIMLNYSDGRSSSFGGSPSRNMGQGGSEMIDHEVRPREFQTLLRGGPPKGVVEGIVYQSGRQWSTGKLWRKTGFSQCF
ncbi:MAG: type IV secretory system conjugative DNA transfer family protein [Verrucomicrobiota bacterium]